MKLKTKLVAFGAFGAIGAAAIGVARAIRRREASSDVDSLFDSSDLDEPVIISEEVIVITDEGSDDIESDLFTDTLRR
jgi:hypothetical protein